jgi:large subunit ribosomal protein L11
MGEQKTVMALVVGGEANAGPPLGPTLGPLGVNVMEIVKQINSSTASFKGMRVPVKVIVDTDTKGFVVEVGIPTTSALIVKEAGVEKGSGNPKTTLVGNLTMKQVAQIASLKLPQSYGATIKAVAGEVVGCCVSMGVKIEGRDPREAIKEIESGKWDAILSS